MQSLTFWKTDIRRVRALLIALALVFVCAFGFTAEARADSDGMLRVKLTRIGAPSAITLEFNCDYYLADDPGVRIASGSRASITAQGEEMTLAWDHRQVALGRSAKLMRAEPGNRGLRFVKPELSNCFCGDLGLSASGGAMTACLNIYIENYLYGVVGYVMPPSSGIEALKAQAVAARTYALRKKASRSDAAYDLTDAASDQVFKGFNDTPDYANVIRAVDDTRGGVLYYGGSLAQCSVCASNGGQTESAKNAWGTALEYTVVRDDTYDLQSASAPAKVAVINKDLTDLKPELKEALHQGISRALLARDVDPDQSELTIDGIEGITPCDPRFEAPSRVYRSLMFRIGVTGRDGKGSVTVSVPTFGGFEDWYGLSLNDEDNETVWVRENDTSFSIAFRRSGSGVGMSLRGAQAMANSGLRASEILAFYYPGTEARRLSLTDATRDNRAVGPSVEQRTIATARLSDRTDLLGTPSPDGAVTATVAAGAAVEIYGARNDWAAVGSGGKYGYVPIDALEGLMLSGGTVIQSKEPAPARLTAECTVRRLPESTAAEVDALAGGSQVQVYAWNEDWSMIRAAGDIRGFVPTVNVSFAQAEPARQTVAGAEAFVETGGASSARVDQETLLYDTPAELAQALETLKKDVIVQVLAYNRTWARVRTAKNEGYVLMEDLAEAGQARQDSGEIHRVKGKKFMYVAAGLAEMYAANAPDSQVVGTLFYGAKVRVGAYNDAWACVRLNGLTGYVPMSALSETRPANAEGGAFAQARNAVYGLTDRGGVELRDAPAVSAGSIAVLESGQRVLVIAYNEKWALVRGDAGAGYVPIDSLKRG